MNSGWISLKIVVMAALVTIFASVLADPTPMLAESNDSSARTYGRQKERDAMVATQLKGFGRTTITDPDVLKAMLKVPRHLFIPRGRRRFAYDDTPVPIGYGQTISQPYIVALMTQALGLKPGMKVLEVGTGSGYQAAILAEITPHVFSIEIIDPLYRAAQDRLGEMGYESITLRNGDGYYGMEDHAPFDRIIVTCAALHVPPPLYKQLKPSGRMIIPVGGRYETQRLLLVRKGKDGKRRSRSLELVRFVPLVRGKTREGGR
jgi:protein-L-isoaspartate(D-aspartate) O-methyltransferase